MTVVIAVKTILDITLIADSRISYEDGTFEQERGVMKLIERQIRDTPYQVVFGYSGKLAPLNEIFAHLFYEKLPNYRRSFTMASFAEDVWHWLSDFCPRMSLENRQRLKKSEIMLCGFDVYRRDQIQGQKSLQWLQRGLPPASHIFKYTFTDSGQVIKQPQGLVCVIGSGKKQKRIIEGFIHDLFINRTRASNATQVEPLFLMAQISEFFEHMQLPGIGAPFQFLHMGPSLEVFPVVHWIDGNDQWAINADGAIEITNEPLGRKYLLLPLKQCMDALSFKGKGASAK